MLDEAMAQLGKKDRDAVILRFFKEKNLCEVAAAFNVTEAAAQSRVHRALEKLRKFYIRRGIALSAAAIAGADLQQILCKPRRRVWRKQFLPARWQRERWPEPQLWPS